MSFDRAAYMRAYRRRRRSQGICPSCGLAVPPANVSTKCRECRAVDKAKEKHARRYRHLGKAVEPVLKAAMSRGDYALISPSQCKAMLDLLNQPGATT